MALQPFVGLWPLFSFLILYTVGRTPWTGDQSVARPLPTHRETQTESKHTDIHVSSVIRTHDLRIRAGEVGSCLRPRGHCDRYYLSIFVGKSHIATCCLESCNFLLIAGTNINIFFHCRRICYKCN
jgi:hypothetical protein